SRRGKDLRQRLLRLVNGHAGSARSDLLVAVRVAQQHALLSPVSFQVTLIQRIGEKLLDHLPTALETIDRLELWRDVERDLASLFVVNRGPAGEQERGEHVVRALCAA